MKFLFWFWQILYLFLISIPIYFAWTNQMTFRIGFEQRGKWFITIVMLLIFLIAEIVVWGTWEKGNDEVS